MAKAKDEDIETRAVEYARADHLEWVKRPRQLNQPDTPAGATNAERDDYRQQAREQIADEERQGAASVARPAAYQARLIGPGSTVESSISIMAEDEPSAIAKARELARSQTVELWGPKPLDPASA